MTPTSFMRKGWSKIKKGIHADAFFIFAFSILFVCCLYGCAHFMQRDHQPIETQTILTSEEAQNPNVLQNELKLNKPNAELAAAQIRDAQTAVKRPQTVYNEVYESGGSVTHTVQKKLAKSDPTLPPEALAKTDKTVVAEQPENKDVPVGIYKINNYRNWELGIGTGVHDGNPYIPISLQRNYSKNHSVVLEIHYDLRAGKVNGGEVQWKVHF